MGRENSRRHLDGSGHWGVRTRKAIVTITIYDEIDPTIPIDGLLNSGLNLYWVPNVGLDWEAAVSSDRRKLLGNPFKALLATIQSEKKSPTQNVKPTFDQQSWNWRRVASK